MESDSVSSISDARLDEHYWLTAHVSVCRAGDYFVFLDQKANRYFGASAAHMQACGVMIDGWRWPMDRVLSDGTDAEVAELLSHLVESGFLTKAKPVRRTSVEDPDLPLAEDSLIDDYAEIPSHISGSDLWQFGVATLAARFLLRFRSLESIIRRIRKRRAHDKPGDAACTRSAGTTSLNALRERIAVFRRLRPLLLRTSDACLLNSLVLAEYLANYRMYPTFVFGVRTAPFGAHCWLQQSATVLDDAPSNVRQFTPILAA